VAAGDTFRAAAGEQLQEWADRSGAEMAPYEVRHPKNNKINKMIDAAAIFFYQGWFRNITLHVVVAYLLLSIRLAPPAECQRFVSYQSDRYFYRGLAMCWQCVGNVLATCCQCVANVLPMCWQCVGNVLAMCWQRIDTVLAMCWQHIGNKLTMCWQCVGNVLPMCCQCIVNVFAMCWQCVGNVFAMCCQCVANVLPMCCQCVANVLPMCWQCVCNVIAMCCQCVKATVPNRNVEVLKTLEIIEKPVQKKVQGSMVHVAAAYLNRNVPHYRRLETEQMYGS
jgi:hypothetical protein